MVPRDGLDGRGKPRTHRDLVPGPSSPQRVAIPTELTRSKTFPITNFIYIYIKVKGKYLPQQAEVAQGVPGRLRPRIFLTFGTRRVVDRQP